MKKKVRKKVLVIVAHPDDETIWMGGTLLRHEFDWDITIISLCRARDSDRAPKFRRVCKIYGAKCNISDLDDSESGNFLAIKEEEIISRIKRFTDGKSYDLVFTHGRNGEYGHKRHKQVHQAVVSMIKEKILTASTISFFSYFRSGEFCYANKSSDKFIKLKAVHFIRKKELIKNVYGFNPGSFEDRCSRDVESFKTKKEI